MKMIFFKILFTIAFLGLGTWSLSTWMTSNEKNEAYTITGVERIFFHEPTHISLAVRSSDNQLKLQEFRSKNIIIYTNVEPKNEMWAKIGLNSGLLSNGFQAKNDWFETIELHIHSAKDIDGGAWDHGKFGNGQTNILE